MENSAYIHGTAPEEQERLARLNRLTNPSFLHFVQTERASSILEVGSGLGILSREMALRAPAAQVCGVEFSSQQIAEARRCALPNLSFVQADAHRLPFDSGTFDVVYCRFVLEHLARPQQALDEMLRVLRPGGVAYVQENNILVNVFDPDCPSFDRLWRNFVILQRRLGGDAQIGRRLFALLRAAGFSSIELSLDPEAHAAGQPGFLPWVRNLQENIIGARSALLREGLATEQDIEAGLRELDGLAALPYASSYFYWNRARGIKSLS